MFGALALAVPQCDLYIQDVSPRTYHSNCGVNTWQLTVEGTSGEQFYGAGTAYGVCTGGFIDCSGHYEPQSFINGEKTFFVDYSGGPVEQGFTWTLDFYTAHVSQCPNDPNWVAETETDNSTEYDEVYECYNDGN